MGSISNILSDNIFDYVSEIIKLSLFAEITKSLKFTL